MFAMYLNDIADELERKEADADRQYDVQRTPVHVEPYSLQHAGDRVGEEIQILEGKQGEHINDYSDPQKQRLSVFKKVTST